MCASFVLTLPLVTIVGNGTAVVLVGAFNVELYLDIGLKATGRFVTRRKRNVLSGENSDGEMEGFARNDVDSFFVVAIGSIAWIRLAICNMSVDKMVHTWWFKDISFCTREQALVEHHTLIPSLPVKRNNLDTLSPEN